MPKRGGKAAEPTLNEVKAKILKKIAECAHPETIDKLADAYETLARAELSELGALRELFYLEEMRSAGNRSVSTTATPILTTSTAWTP